MGSIGRGEHRLPGSQYRGGLTVMDHRWRQQTQAPVVVLVVLPLDELAAELQAVFDAGETVGELRLVLHRLELALRERIVVGDVRPTVGLGDSQRGQELGHGLRTHRRPTIAVDRQLVPNNPLFHHGLADQPLGQMFTFAAGQHPAHHVAAEDVEDHVKVEVESVASLPGIVIDTLNVVPYSPGPDMATLLGKLGAGKIRKNTQRVNNNTR